MEAVWFLPTAVPPHKQERELTPAAARIEMLELAIAGNPAFAVCHYEAERGGVNYTADTLTHFREEDPGRELFLLLGADMLVDLPNWRSAARVVELALPVAVCRPGWGPIDFERLRGIAAAEPIELMRRHQVDMPVIGISSSEIRRRVALGKSTRYLAPRAVEMYIETHGLYRAARGESLGLAEDRRAIEAARRPLAESQ